MEEKRTRMISRTLQRKEANKEHWFTYRQGCGAEKEDNSCCRAGGSRGPDREDVFRWIAKFNGQTRLRSVKEVATSSWLECWYQQSRGLRSRKKNRGGGGIGGGWNLVSGSRFQEPTSFEGTVAR
eukprot:1563969-Pyramimonas_sp.AAC.1